MKLRKKNWQTGLLIMVLWGMYACQNDIGTASLDFHPLKIEEEAALGPESHSPTCQIGIAIDEANDTSLVARKINQAIAEAAFGNMSRSLSAAADSFSQTYVRQYKEKLYPLYLADIRHGADASWYDYRFRLTTEHRSGKDGCLCYLIHKTRYEGGAREYQETISLNFDLNTGNLIQLDEVFLPTYRILLPPLLQRRLQADFDCQSLEELQDKGILRLAGIYIPANYEIGEDGITFIYNTDEIAPHETGSITITLSYEEMETFMKPQNN